MLIYTRVFFSVGVVVGWLVGLVESFFLSYLFICCFKIKYAYIEFSLMSGQCVWFMNAAHTIFFWMQARYPLSLIDTSSPISLAKLWL